MYYCLSYLRQKCSKDSRNQHKGAENYWTTLVCWSYFGQENGSSDLENDYDIERSKGGNIRKKNNRKWFRKKYIQPKQHRKRNSASQQCATKQKKNSEETQELWECKLEEKFCIGEHFSL